MNTKILIEKVINSGVLIKELIDMPRGGASNKDLEASEARIGTKIDGGLKELLRSYNGANLDVIRFYSCDRLEATKHGLLFADDPSGFIYYIDDSGVVICEDTDGGNINEIASSVTDFIHSYLFGKRSAEFAGKEYHRDLIKAGIAT